MTSRYRNNKTKKLKSGDVVYRTKIYPDIPLRDDDIYAVVQTGDRLDTLANQFYNDSTLWWIIAKANNIHDAPFSIADGTILRIPRDYMSIVRKYNK